MDTLHTDELVKRIAKLVKQNTELTSEVKKLNKQTEKLAQDNEELKKVIASAVLVKTEAHKDEKIEEVISKKFKMVTVLFADIQGFGKISDNSDSQSMIDNLDSLFFAFDSIVKKYKIEKIKTIGDAYMAAGGIPEKNITNPVEVVLAAHQMQKYLLEHEDQQMKIWDLRMGVHTGPVTAMITGKKKASYDIKGDTVNIATRLEAAGKPGEIVISVMTYELVKEFFICEYFGKMPVKYMGDLEIYSVKGIRPELTKDDLGFEPNQNFWTKFGLVQFTDLQEVILEKLEIGLPKFLYYHNVKHTVDVTTQVELIGWGEGVNDEEILLLKTAGLFHDAGHTIEYDNHEYHGTIMAREILPGYNYSNEQIDKICEIIMATKLPPKPQTLLQQIICDSDLDYLGRIDFVPVSNTLYRELKAQGKLKSLNDWNKLQVKFLSNHQFFTKTALSLREVNKQKQVERISSLIFENEEEAKKFEDSLENELDGNPDFPLEDL